MNIESMRTRSYRSFKVDDAELSEQARGRLLAIRRFEALRAAGCAEQAALEEIGVSRRTVFRWKAALAARGQRGLEPESTRPRRVRRPSYRPGDAKAVMDLRRKHPFMGKAPIQRMLERKGRRLSVSTVGRILSRAIADGRVPRASVCEGRLQPRRRRKFNGWAQRWKYGARPRRPGQLVQIDHMTFSRDGQTIKEFRAVCPASRFMVARVFSRATAFNARRFLDDVVEALPVPLRSVQVDGGSEFMRHSWRSELRGRMPGARHRTPRPAAAPPAVERLRRTRQPNRPHRVLELPRLRTHRPGRLRQAPPVRVLLQLPAAPVAQAVPPGRRRGVAVVAGAGERGEAVAVVPGAVRGAAAALPVGVAGARVPVQEPALLAGLDGDRSVPGDVSVGEVPADEGRGEGARGAGPRGACEVPQPPRGRKSCLHGRFWPTTAQMRLPCRNGIACLPMAARAL